jgi:hypothetical protein
MLYREIIAVWSEICTKHFLIHCVGERSAVNVVANSRYCIATGGVLRGFGEVKYSQESSNRATGQNLTSLKK